MADSTADGARSRGSDRLEATIADALVRLDVLGRPDAEVEREAGIPGAFLAKARAGKGRGERAAGSWAKLVAWLARQGGPVAKGLAPVAPPVVAASSSPAEAAPVVIALPRSEAHARAELLGAIEAARTAKDYTAVARRVASMMAVGILDRGDADAILGALREARASRKVEREENAREAVRALEVLTPAEAELLRRHRAELAGPPMQPGEMAPPPIAVTTKGEAR
jgi:hypothetical protein